MSTITGTGIINSNDYTTVKWTGKTKGGQAVVIQLDNAINLGDIDWTMAEKDDVVGSITMTACYENTDETADTTAEPWSISTGSLTGGAGEILLGVGVFSINGVDVALTRGGGSFKVAREYRRINADGDRGPVKDRIVIEGSEATLTMNVLTMLTNMANLYTGVNVATAPSG